MEKEFARNLPIKDHEELSACQINSLYDNVIQRISLSTMRISDFRMITLKERFDGHIPAVCTPLDNKTFITYNYCFGIRRRFLYNYRTMYIVVHLSIIGEIEAPLHATHPIQGIPNEQSFSSFNPPYSISLNQKALSFLEIRLYSETRELISFEAIWRFVVQLLLKRQRPPL